MSKAQSKPNLITLQTPSAKPPKSKLNLPITLLPATLTKSYAQLDTVRSAFRDPDLQLVTSARLLTVDQVGHQLYNCTEHILHRLIFQKEFSTLLKVFQGMKQ